MKEYQLYFLDVKDADCNLIKYKNKVILIDAGNISDSQKIIDELKKINANKIDLAVCSHPDKDHIGGFFGLIDSNVEISQFWYIDPAKYLDETDVKYYTKRENVKREVRKIFDEPNASGRNLLDLLTNRAKISVESGYTHEEIPIKVVAPSKKYYNEIVKNMVLNYVETYEDSDTQDYDEKALPDYPESIIDYDDDGSFFNAGSLVLLFKPNENEKILFTGDANCASLVDMLENYGDEVKNISILKVPHHGSKHNLTTEIINKFKPKVSIISAKGTKKHPNFGIVYNLGKHGDVYSTHKSGTLMKNVEGTPAIPLYKSKNN